jgi:site-specific DNA recombinase
MSSLPRSTPRTPARNPAVTAPDRVAILARVSSDEQTERGSIQNQVDFLQKFCDLYRLPVAGTYLDDGVSGTIPLAERPEGRRLLADAAAGSFSVVLVYKVDRLGRSIRVLLDAHEALQAHGVSIRSATEPFDTSNPMGRFLFQLLGSMAELDRATMLEKMTLGRDRHARNGRWLGVIPFGYDVGDDGALTPSARLVPGLGCTEAELAADLYQRIADGSTLPAECARLNALGLAPERRYPSGKAVRITDTWTPGRLCAMLHNPVYAGQHTLNSQYGPIERAVPALVPAALWERAQRQLASNRVLSKSGTARDYLLRGLVRCEQCGSAYVGAALVRRRRDGTPHEWRYYRCNLAVGRGAPACPGKIVSAGKLEAAVWAHCAEFIHHPGPALAEAQAQLRARQGQAADHAAERTTLAKTLADADAQRERVMSMFRKNLITMAEAESQLDASAREQADARALLDALDSADALTMAAEAQVTEAATMLARLRDRLAEVEASDDWATKRAVVALLVRQVRVATTGAGRAKQAEATARYAFGPDVAAVSTTAGAGTTGTR